MNGRTLYPILCSIICLISCAKDKPFDIEVLNNDIEDLIPFTYKIEHPNYTKTFKTDDKNGWCNEDLIYYYANNSLQLRTSKIAIDNDGNASIEFLLNPKDTVFVASYGAPIIVGENFSDDEILLDTSSKLIKTGEFSNSQILVAAGSVNSQILTFYNANGLIKFSTERTDIRYLNIFDNRGKSIDGEQLMLYGNNFSKRQYYNTDGSLSILQLIIDGPGEYYFSIPETSATNYDTHQSERKIDGLVIDCYNAKNEYIGTALLENKIQLGQNQILDIGIIDNHLKNLDEIYILSKRTTSNTPTYLDRKGNTINISKSGNSNYGEKVTYKSTIVVPPANIENITNHPEKIPTVIVYSDDNGLPIGIETDKEILEIKYSEDSRKIIVSSTFRDEVSSEIHQITYQEYENPNYDKRILYPINYDKIKAYYPSDVLTPWKVISPLINLFSLFQSNGIMQGVNAGLLCAGLASSAFATPETSLLVSLVGGIIAIGASIGVLAMSPGILATVALCGTLALASTDVITAFVASLQDDIVYENMGEAVPVTVKAEVLNDTEVRLTCAVTGFNTQKPILAGIMIADGNSTMIAHNYNLARKTTQVEENVQEYSFVFSGLQPNKKYKYRAYLVKNERNDYVRADYCKYGEVKTFCSMYGVDISGNSSNKYVWATCDIGSSNQYLTGTMYTADGGKDFYIDFIKNKADNIINSALGEGWRLPTDSELRSLIYNSDITVGRVDNNDVIIFTSKKTGEKLYFPFKWSLMSSKSNNYYDFETFRIAYNTWLYSNLNYVSFREPSDYTHYFLNTRDNLFYDYETNKIISPWIIWWQPINCKFYIRAVRDIN